MSEDTRLRVTVTGIEGIEKLGDYVGKCRPLDNFGTLL